VGFRRATYTSDDVLLFTKTANINGVFNAQAGILSLTGKAPVEEYIQAIRSVQYNYLKTVDPQLDEKSVSITVNDGTNFSDTKDRVIVLKNTLVELFITEAFTPNGDGKNDFWKITGDVGEFKDAIVRVYNRRGVKVFEATGLDDKWDGTFKGEFLPVDVYFYTIDSKRADKKVYQGTVTILR